MLTVSADKVVIIQNADNSNTTAVASSATSVTLLEANTNRKGGSIYNDSTQTLYVLRGTGTASVTNYSFQISPGGYYEFPTVPSCDVVKGIWPVANGYARVTEET